MACLNNGLHGGGQGFLSSPNFFGFERENGTFSASRIYIVSHSSKLAWIKYYARSDSGPAQLRACGDLTSEAGIRSHRMEERDTCEVYLDNGLMDMAYLVFPLTALTGCQSSPNRRRHRHG